MAQLLFHTKKAQAATELLFAIGFIMLFFIMITLINFERSSNIKDIDKTLDERALCQQISNGISNVYSKGHGTSTVIKFKDHNATFDKNNQVILIDDNYPCTIPLRDISNGTNTTSVFTLTAQDLRLQNINNVVYINSNCFTYYVSDAEDSNGTKYTNKVKYNDNNYANISLSNKIDGSIEDYEDFLRDNIINISFIDVGNECPDLQMNQILQDFGCSDDFREGNAPPTTNCHIYHDNGHIHKFFNNANLLQGYKIVVIEQEQLTNSQLDELEDWVEAGGILIYGDKILSASGNKFGSRWNYKSDTINNNWTALNSFYTNPDSYLELGGTINNKARKDPDAEHYSSDCISCIPDAVNYTVIAEFLNGDNAISRWNFGNGTVYHFSSLCDPQDAYNTGTLTVKINEMIKRMLGSYKYNYLDTVIDFDPELGFNGTTSNITTLKYRINIQSGYNLSLYEKYLGDFILKCTDQTILNNQCAFNPSSLAVNQIRLRTEFYVKELNIINRQVDIDYQDIQICYSL